MRRLFLFICGLMAITLTACVNEKLPQENQFAGEKITVTAYAAGDNTPSTRVAHNNPANDGTITLSWSNDDAFSVIRSGNNTTFNKSTADGAGANDFTGSLPGGDGDYYAVYPTTAVTDHLSVPFDISDQSEGLPYLMYATSQTGNSFHFNHALAYLKVTFPESLENTTATINITAPSGVYTDGTLDLTDGSMSGGSKTTITKTVTFADNTDVLVAIPPMAANNKTLSFSVSVNSKNYTATLAGDNTKDIEEGNYYSAAVSLTEVLPCYLPDGNTFNTNVKNALSSATSIVFKANSNKTEGTIINSTTNSTPAYAKAETVDGNKILYIYTIAPEFVFNANCEDMFKSLSGVTTIDFGGCVNTGNVTDMSGMFTATGVTQYKTLDLSDFNTEKVTDMSNMFSACQNLTSLDVSSFDTKKVTNMAGMFATCKALESLDVSDFNTSSVTDMSLMFYDCVKLSSLDVSGFNTERVTTMFKMFYNCSVLTSIDVANFNTASVTDMSYLFAGCSAVTNLDVTRFSTSDVTKMQNMFSSCKALTALNVSSFNTGNVTNMSQMFNGCNKLAALNVSNFNTAKVENMNQMFGACQTLTELNLSNFNTAKVTDMKSMFYDCQKIGSITFGTYFTTENVTDMGVMFSGCYKLTSLNLSNFNTEKVTKMNSMFSNCQSLTELNLGNNFITSAVTTMESMFNNCCKLTSLNLSSFSTANVTTMKSMFYNCSELTSLDLKTFNTSSVTTMEMMFAYCKKLPTLDLCNFTFNSNCNVNNIFYVCPFLNDVYVADTYESFLEGKSIGINSDKSTIIQTHTHNNNQPQ